MKGDLMRQHGQRPGAQGGTHRPHPYSSRPLRIMWVDPSTSNAVLSTGQSVHMLIRRGIKRAALPDWLATAAQAGAERVMLTALPRERTVKGHHWMEQETPGFQGGNHWLDGAETSHVGRYRNLATGAEIEVALTAPWFGDARLGIHQARSAWELVQSTISRHVPGQTALMKSPAGTGQNIWAHTLPANFEPTRLTADIAEEMHATSGQHHIEHLVKGDHFSSNPDCVPFIDPQARPEIEGFAAIDGRFMYADTTITKELGIGPGRRLKRAEAADLANDPRGIYRPARYHITFQVPDTWEHIGLFGVQSRNDRSSWYWPNRPGAKGQTWVGQRELLLAQKYGWAVDFIEAVEFTSQVPKAYDKTQMTATRPLDKFTEKLQNIRADIEAAEIDPAVKAAARGAVRAILLQTVGMFASRGRMVTRYVDSPMDIPPAYQHEARDMGNGRWSFQERREMTEKQKLFYHPELAMQIWSHARARVLDGGRIQQGALYLPPQNIVGIHGDAVLTTGIPLWSLPTERGGLDDGRDGKLRVKGFLPGPLPVPVTVDERLALTRRAEANGLDGWTGETL